MKAAIFTNGNTVEVKNVKDPIPKPGEVKIRVRAAGICGSDLHPWRSGSLWFPDAAPLIPGHEIAGEVVVVGDGVESINKGDRVAIQPQITCGKCHLCLNGTFQLCPEVKHIGIWYDGGFAEYVTAPKDNVFLIPDNLSFEVASTADVYGCGIHCYNRIRKRLSGTIAIIGTGPIALSTAQIIKQKGRCKVIVIGRRDEALERVKNIGAADAVINKAEENVPIAIGELTEGKGADIVVEAVGGFADTLSLAFEIVAGNGMVGIMGEFFNGGLVPLKTGMEKQIDLLWITGYGNWEGKSEFQSSLDILASGQVQADSIITHRFGLNKIREAFETADNKAKSNAVKVLIIP